MAQWVINRILARSSRPGYPSKSVSIGEVNNWAEDVRAMGIQSIICLLTDEQLAFYEKLPEGLLEYYRKEGFRTESIPITDPADDPDHGWEELEHNLKRILQVFKELPKPVLVHCSAGVDRTGRVVGYISKRWNLSDEERSKLE
jgi:protein tyrosine/serine phosphatase